MISVPSSTALRRRGASSTEYILLVVFVAIALLALVNTFGYQVQKLWRRDTLVLDTGRPIETGGPVTLGTAVAPVVGPVTPRNFPAGGEITPEVRGWDAVEELLQQSAVGRDALRYAREHNVEVRLVPGIGSQFNPPSGPIDLNTDGGAEDMALTFVHEVNHARGAASGAQPNVSTAPRATYVNGMIAEEVDGTVASIETKRELVAAGRPVTATFPLEAEYTAAYNTASAAFAAANPGSTPAQRDAAGRAAGRQAVLDGFNNGSVIAGNTQPPTTYPQYYGQYWDSVNAPAAGS